MDVSLLSKRGVPDDAIISIRSGSVRRQGAVSADKPFRFPQNVSESDCVVKVDIMQTIGSGYIVMRPNQADSKQYEVILGDNSDIACELEVTPTSGGGPTPEAAEDAAAAAKCKQDAKAYLETTGLLQFVQGVLQVVAKQQPEDPFAAMAKHFLSASNAAEPPKQPGSPKSAPALAKAVDETPAPASPKAETPAPASPAGGAGEAGPTDEGAAAGEAAPEGGSVVDDQKSDNLEEFTSTVKSGALPTADVGATTETNAAAEVAAADASPADVEVADAAKDGAAEGEAAQQEESAEKPPEEAVADETAAA